jgi:hypothetical protein
MSRKDEGKEKPKAATAKAKAVEDYVKGLVSRGKETAAGVEKEYDSKVRGRALHLDNQLKPKQVSWLSDEFVVLMWSFVQKKWKKNRKALNAKKKRAIKAFHIPKDQRRFLQ